MRRMKFVVAVILTAVVGLGGVPLVAAADAGGATVRGIVRDQRGNPVAGICVRADPPPRPEGDGSEWPEPALATTDSGGRYSLGGLGQTMPYRVRAWDCSGVDRGLAPASVGGPTEAMVEQLSPAAGSVTERDIVVVDAATVSGHVTVAGGAPAGNVCVSWFSDNWAASQSVDESGTTSADGSFTIRGVAPGAGAVKVSYCGNPDVGWFSTQFSGGAPTKAQALRTSVRAGAHVVDDVIIHLGGATGGEVVGVPTGVSSCAVHIDIGSPPISTVAVPVPLDPGGHGDFRAFGLPYGDEWVSLWCDGVRRPSVVDFPSDFSSPFWSGAVDTNPWMHTSALFWRLTWDDVGPTVTYRLDGPLSSSGWYSGPVTATPQCSDPHLSECSQPVVIQTSTDRPVIHGVDRAGNETRVTVSAPVDREIPDIVVDNWHTTYTYDERIDMVCRATDDASGIASIDGCGPLHGVPASSLPPGTYTYPVVVTDRVGRQRRQDVTFTRLPKYVTTCDPARRVKRGRRWVTVAGACRTVVK